MKLFEKILMASEDVKAYLVSGRCAADELADGTVVTIGDLVDHEVYTGVKDMNTRAITKGMTANARYGIVDYVNVNETTAMGVKYRVGDKTAGLVCPAGVPTRVRIPQVGDEFFIGNSNFATGVTPAAGTTYGADANGEYVAVANAVGTFRFKTEYSTNKITGAVNDGTKFFCTVTAI